jgi:hypothetical protein
MGRIWRFDSSGGVAECDWARLILSAECGPSCYGKCVIDFGFAIAVKARTCCALLDGCSFVGDGNRLAIGGGILGF